jgi:hypothetical protein
MINQVENKNALMVVTPARGSSVAKGAVGRHRDQRHEEDVIVLKPIKERSSDWTAEKGSLIDLYV